jgi:hypothetical protein
MLIPQTRGFYWGGFVMPLNYFMKPTKQISGPKGLSSADEQRHKSE